MRTYRASSLGSCTRAQIALQLGMTALGASDKMQAIYDRANTHEVECLAAMEAEGFLFVRPGAYRDVQEDDGQHYVALEVAGAVITGHLDGIDTGHGTASRVVEIKSPISWAKWERAHKTGDYSDPLMSRYAWQISVYMVATGLEAVIACVEDGQVRTFGIEVPPHDVSQIANRVAIMETYIQMGSDPMTLECSQSDYPCPVAYLHEQKEVVEDKWLDALMASYARFKADRDHADEQMKVERAAIDAHLGLLDTLTTAAGTATRVTTSRTTYDTKAAIADGIDLSAYAKQSSSTSIRITPKVDSDTPEL